MRSSDLEQMVEPFLAASAADFANFATAVEAHSRLIEVAARPQGRKMRGFRTNEVLALTGLTLNQFRTWRIANRDSLEIFQNIADGDPAPPFTVITLAELHRLMDDFGIRPHKPDGSRAMRMGIFNFKGGSTKSTTTYHLSTWAAIHGYRVLVIDADPQGSLSDLFGVRTDIVDEKHTLAPAYRAVTSRDLFDQAHLEPLSTHIDGLDIVPASLDMIGSDFDITAAFMNDRNTAAGFYTVVARAIASVEDNYDLIFIDGAPSFSFAAVATFWSVDGMIVPMPPVSPDFKATGKFCEMASTALESLCIRAGCPDRLWAPFMVIHNRVRRNATTEEIRKASTATFGRFKVEDVIPENPGVAAALAMSMSVFEATSAEINPETLKVARDAYDLICRRVIGAIRTAWSQGIAKAEDPA